jgi:hypothetical protein
VDELDDEVKEVNEVDDADEVCKAKYSAADDQTTKQTVAEVN